MSAFTIVVPAFNEERALPSVLAELRATCPGAEIIVVDDGSTDATAGIARASGVTVVSHGANRGYGAALKAGIRHAKNERLAFFDADGQHDPRYVVTMIEGLDTADLVIGERTNYTRTSPLHFTGRLVLSQVVKFLARMPLRDINCGLRAARRSVLLRYLGLLPDGFSFATTSTVTFAKFGSRLTFQPVDVRERIGKSSVRLVRDGYNTFLLILRLIALFEPLRVFVPPSFVLMAAGVAYGVFKYVTLPVYTGL